jgi:transcription elongation GreA/GreB family factor
MCSSTGISLVGPVDATAAGLGQARITDIEPIGHAALLDSEIGEVRPVVRRRGGQRRAARRDIDRLG